MEPGGTAMEAAEAPSDSDLPVRLVNYFDAAVGALAPAVRHRINAKLALDVTGSCGGSWTVDFLAPAHPYTREGIAPDWTYKIQVEDKLIYAFLIGRELFFEDILLSLRVQFARRPDEYNEPLYHFLYEPDPEKLHNWYAAH